MPSSAVQIDRYVSFAGNECDECARRLVAAIHASLGRLDERSAWHDYFRKKLAEIEHRGQDELYFVGSQVNSLRELFEQTANDTALRLLERVEHECC
ncbi:N(2)-fixation sustaining protein CowN [Thioalkalicoccus limnaeus]|uniref:N(2)-fixation sustaining protein CowN n=1 Tax=Thioalkalicoccus limnaeus TaxID=120681 RepID=A0ABV4BJD4_9GAMM